MNDPFTVATLGLGMIAWNLVFWVLIGFLALLVYCPMLWRIDGCWTHSVATKKDRVADWIGYHIEMREYFRLLLAAPILVPVGLVTVHRNGLYGERRRPAEMA
ncbi:hypothetical protein HY634_01125 [Candidatus Uhrbacteria bacterium]|nr:hypothetical protein [Candidatus Uhrbacteria bacterium]